jgi:hypothetical protein
MEMEKLLVVFFVIVIILTIISILPSKNQTGQFLSPSKINIEASIILVLFSIIIISFILVPKRYYNPVPYMLA